MTDKRHIDPGRFATSEEVQKAEEEALALLQTLYPLNLPKAAEHIRDNPPSPEAIATLGFSAYRVIDSAQSMNAARAPRPKTRAEQVRSTGAQSYKELKDKAPELCLKWTKEQLTQTISKVKRKKNLP